MLKRGRNWSEGNGSRSAGKMVTRGLLKPQETGLNCSGKGLYIPSNPCPVWGGKGTLSLLLPFFHTGVRNRHIRVVFPGNSPLQPGFRAHSCAKTWGRLRVEAALGHLSGVCSCFGFSPAFLAVSPCLSWTGRCRLFFSAPAMPGRVCGVVTFASRAFS